MRQHPFSGGSLYTPAGQRKYLTAAERERFIETAQRLPRQELRSLCLTLVYTGCRVSEALALTGGSVDLESGFISIRCLKKRGKLVVREVPIPPDLMRALAEVHACNLDLYSTKLWGLSRSRVWQLVKAVMIEAGIPRGLHATPKGLRHAFGLHAVRSGVPLNLVQRWLGHASMTTTAIYLQAMGAEEREIAGRMWVGQSECSMNGN
jgi:integrase/recombinase XerD